jgi:molecular chaperone DnaJ
MARDYYEVLGVGRDATEDELKSAYRQLARRFHPDANPDDPGAADKFKELAEAYSVLSDSARRRDYDMFGTARTPAGGFDPFDIFASFFGRDPFGPFGGRGGRRSSAQHGNDLALGIEVTLEEVVTGATKTVTIRNLQTCERCDGSGCEPGTSPSRCSRCTGAGAIRSVQRSVFGNLMTSYTCPQCHGAGEEIAAPCHECNGDGRMERLDEVSVDVPPGVDEGAQFRISGKGEAGARGGRTGDLYVQVRVKSHERFRRSGDDLVVTVTVPFTQAALGAALEIDSFDGLLELNVPPGTQPGAVVKLRGKGVPRLHRNGRGDLLVEVAVEVPRNLTPAETDLLRRFAAERGEAVEQDQGILGRIRGAFRP